MAKPTKDVFKDLTERGLIYQTTDPNLSNTLMKESLTLYIGFDPSSDSLHLGNLLQIMSLRRFQDAGHKPIAVIGGATGMVGDPSGKSSERNLLSEDQLDHNIKCVENELRRYLDESGLNGAIFANNRDWFKEFGYLEFLRDVGKHFSVNQMVAKESVRARLEDRDQGISYTEFSYMLLQAYDFYVLNQKYNCRLQVGGSDQWGNITAGCELIRRMNAAHGNKNRPEIFGLTTPLITKSDGSKFGKSEKGAMWLDTKKTSPYQLYQFLVRTQDSDVIPFLKYFTFLSLDEIAELEKKVKDSPEKREAQTRLAEELLLFLHGKDALGQAKAATQAFFGTEIKQLDQNTLLDVFSDAPSTELSKDKLGGLSLVDLLVQSQLCKSKGAARKDIESGGIYVNNERKQDSSMSIEKNELIAGHYVVLRKGKKTYHLVSFK